MTSEVPARRVAGEARRDALRGPSHALQVPHPADHLVLGERVDHTVRDKAWHPLGHWAPGRVLTDMDER